MVMVMMIVAARDGGGRPSPFGDDTTGVATASP